MNLFSRRACSKIPSDQGCQAMDLRAPSGAAPSKLTDSVRNKNAASFFIQPEYANQEHFGCGQVRDRPTRSSPPPHSTKTWRSSPALYATSPVVIPHRL